jgi:peptidyl-tRNA hydrolase, PTH1 family
MKFVIGLGNPGEKYQTTRHNAGFLAIDFYLRDKQPIACASKFAATICELHYPGGTKVYFVKPQSFMNKSGEVVRDLLSFYKADPRTDMLVLHDEKDLPLGVLRPTDNSSSAGHNGVQNIIDLLGSQNFPRLRIGVETRPPGSPIPTDVFVLQNFTPEELARMNEEILPEVSRHIESFIQE